MTKEEALQVRNSKLSLQASRPSLTDSLRRPELIWIEDWKNGECQRVRLFENGVSKNPVAWLTQENAKPAEKPEDYPPVVKDTGL